MRQLQFILPMALVLLSHSMFAQPNEAEQFPELIMTKIPGAPSLGDPMLIKNAKGTPLIGEGYGIAAPAFYDWNGDGLSDLLVGEFGSGMELGRYNGNFIRIYLNNGTEDNPVFDGDYKYAWPPHQLRGNGTPYSVDQFCCMAFTPLFVDLNDDGVKDLVSGQYFGEVIFFEGTEKGFLSGKAVKQPGNPREQVKDYEKHQEYWLYSSAGFGDFTGDNLLDMVVGGSAIRLSSNKGGETPSFNQRELLLDTKGNPLKVYNYTKEELARGYGICIGGDYKLSPVVVDWDNDGVLDLLVTNGYFNKGLSVIDFFKGEKMNGSVRFRPPVPLFSAKDGKAFPGISPFVSVTDWNSDGVNDLLIGVSVATTKGQFNAKISWEWEKDMGFLGFGKDPGFLVGKNAEVNLNAVLEGVKLPIGVTKEDFMTMRHQGYVYVMLGKK